MTAQLLPHPFITTEIICNYDRYKKKTLRYIIFYNPYSRLSYKRFFKIIFSCRTLSSFIFSETQNHKNPSPRTGPQDLLVTHYDCEENEQKKTLH